LPLQIENIICFLDFLLKNNSMENNQLEYVAKEIGTIKYWRRLQDGRVSVQCLAVCDCICVFVGSVHGIRQGRKRKIGKENLVPNRLYPHYLLAKLYHEMGPKDRAEAEINIVLTKPPKVESMAVEEMREELIELRTKNQ
jgi:hypothetical protein